MNEIDPPKNSNGTTTENHQEIGGNNTSSSPLLSSLLATPKFHEAISNGQQQQQEIRANDLMMPSSVGGGHRNASAIVANPQYEEKRSTDKELDLSATTNSHKKFSNLSEILQRNNNNSETSAKSILENCLLKPSPVKTNHHRLESQFYHLHNNKMDETGSSSSPLLKFAPTAAEENRKVEPLKINLNREPIRTVIKLPPSNVYESPTKITIKSPQPPPPLISTGAITTNQSISPTLSSSSSLSSESSYDHYNETHHHHRSIQVVPKLHLRNLLDTSLNHEQSELTIVPKLTITGLNSSQEKQQPVDHSVNSILESHTIPKLTIKKDNNSTEAFYHLNNETSASSTKRKQTNHHHHSNAASPKLTIKPIPEQPPQILPPVPKLTIKTTDNDTMTVTPSIPYEAATEHHQAAIPKITIKAKQVTKSIRPLPSPPPIDDDSDLSIVEQEDQMEESIPKLTLKAVHTNSGSSVVPTFEKVVPKLVVKLPRDPSSSSTIPMDEYEKESSSASSTPSPPLPQVSKLNIKPIPFPSEKEVPMKEPVKNCIDQPAVKFSINRLIGNETNDDENLKSKPLEINTSSIKSADSGQDSPRIILKINKTSNESTITETPSSTVVVVNSNKRAHSNDSVNDKETIEEDKKRPKLATGDDVIVIDSDASNEASNHMNKGKNHLNQEANHQTTESEQVEATPVLKIETDSKGTSSPLAPASNASTGRSLRNRRNHEVVKKPVKTPAPIEIQPETSQLSISVKEDSQPSEIDPLALSNDAMTNSNSVDELITPKRGRGRPKKPQLSKELSKVIKLDTESRDPLEIPSISAEESQENKLGEGEEKKTPGRGRGRGRGRLKRTVEVIKNGKPIQITLEGHDDDDSPSFSLYNRGSLRGGLTNKRGRGGKTMRGGKSSKSSPFITPERSKDGIFTTPSDSKVSF